MLQNLSGSHHGFVRAPVLADLSWWEVLRDARWARVWTPDPFVYPRAVSLAPLHDEVRLHGGATSLRLLFDTKRQFFFPGDVRVPFVSATPRSCPHYLMLRRRRDTSLRPLCCSYCHFLSPTPFADIERFSLLAETMPPSQLAEVCTGRRGPYTTQRIRYTTFYYYLLFPTQSGPERNVVVQCRAIHWHSATGCRSTLVETPPRNQRCLFHSPPPVFPPRLRPPRRGVFRDDVQACGGLRGDR